MTAQAPRISTRKAQLCPTVGRLMILTGCILATAPAFAADKYFAPLLIQTESGTFSDPNAWVDGFAVATTPPTAADNAFFNGYVVQDFSTVAFTAPAASATLGVYDQVIFNLGGNTYSVTGDTAMNPSASLTLNGGTLSTGTINTALSAGSSLTTAAGATLLVTNTTAGLYSVALKSAAQLTVNGSFSSAGSVVGVGVDAGQSVFTVSGVTATGSAKEIRVGEDSGDADTIAGTGIVNVTNGATLGVNNAGSGFLRVGYAGTGALNVSTGGKVIVDGQIILGTNAGVAAAATVDGANSKITLAAPTGGGTFFVGVGGSGTLDVKNSGAVATDAFSVGRNLGSTGKITLDGEGSKINVTGSASSNFRVGRDGSGEVVVQNGGDLTGNFLDIGFSVGSVGKVTVTGAGSTMVLAQAAGVGGSSSASGGTGTLTVSNGGFFSTASTLKVWDGGTLTLGGGTAKATGGFTFASADVKGSGTLDGNVVSNGTTYAPGASPGLLTVTGSLGLSATDTLMMELAGSALAQFDRFVVAGGVSLGNAVLNLSLLAGFEANAAVNDTLVLIDNTSATPIGGQFAGIAEGQQITIGADQFTASYIGGTGGNDFVLRVTQVPEPASAALLLGSLGLLIARRRRVAG